MTIIEQINQGIKEAIKAQNQVRLATLRMLKSKILAVDARCALPDAEVLKLFKTYYGNLQEACEQAQELNRPEIAAQLKQEMQIVQEFLPKVPSAEETKQIVLQAISESGAKSKKELGLVMKAAMKINSAIDGKMTKDLAMQLLADG
ncbi:MAG: GatB/YqeY domain-containing protein [Verrucomicrobia bacterium]|nr:GatB/YqeY domain-containing protein [Verrucomicrobiota bacterium]MBU6445793.1 GatB/YqeY domain-containing protein [Verrucomicrobiota bacterium]MDE3047425.1 GatB/YqeY domain-containing protein [Verrucomicrobiota bacterium]